MEKFRSISGKVLKASFPVAARLPQELDGISSFVLGGLLSPSTLHNLKIECLRNEAQARTDADYWVSTADLDLEAARYLEEKGPSPHLIFVQKRQIAKDILSNFRMANVIKSGE
ncbi:MAG TPA: hypothetical protein VJ455_07880 [Ignavibacteria bacterium]|nr:hypothetical protein [Ignavibacteria bacterium]